MSRKLVSLIVACLTCSFLVMISGCAKEASGINTDGGDDSASMAALLDKNDVSVSMDIDYAETSFEEDVLSSTHIITVEFVEFYDHNGAGFHVTEKVALFKFATCIKGNIENDKELIYVILTQQEQANGGKWEYNTGETYLLLLEKHGSLFSEHDKYLQVGRYNMPINSNECVEYIETAKQILSKYENTAPAQYGANYTVSTDIEKILPVSGNIFQVRIINSLGKSTYQPSEVFECEVVKTLRNKPVNAENILVVMYADSVSIGKEYVILLADATETEGMVFTISSPNSVFTWEEAEQTAELREMCENAADFEPEPRKTFEEQLKDEESRIDFLRNP